MELDHDQEQNDLEQTFARAGAQAAPPVELPPVVWLRGDEPECAEFVLEADDVMARLGIRRSRLTQLSGRELRVGRIRRGRYITPVYRQVDVEAYLAATRPTASHQRSSSVLSDAAESLRRQGEALSERLHAVPEQLVDQIRGLFQDLDERLQNEVHEASGQTGAELQRLGEQVGVVQRQNALLSDLVTSSHVDLASQIGAVRGEQTQATERSLGHDGRLSLLTELVVTLTTSMQRNALDTEHLRAAQAEQSELLRQLFADVTELRLALSAAIADSPEPAATPRSQRKPLHTADERRLRSLVQRSELQSKKYARSAALGRRHVAKRPNHR